MMIRSRPIRIFSSFMAAALLGLISNAQKLDAGGQGRGCSSGPNTGGVIEIRYRALRTLEDPGTHQRWLLLEDLGHPAGPAVFVKDMQPSGCTVSRSGKGNDALRSGAGVHPMAVMHAGDRILLSEHTAIADAELEAMALGQAAAGDPVSVRVRFASVPVRAIAVAPGRASLGSPADGARP